MKKHNWTLEIQDFGHVGSEDCWVCEECGADGGFSSYRPDDKPAPPRHGYSTDRQGPLFLPEDCDLAKAMMEAYDLGKEAGRYQQRMDALYENVHRPFKERLNYLLLKTFK